MAGAVPVAALASGAHSGALGSVQTGDRWYPDDYYDGDYYPPAYYRPAPAYRNAPPPPAAIYRPPVYGWSYVPPPPPPSSCGAYRYWNGDYCADARDEPPYVGPRW